MPEPKPRRRKTPYQPPRWSKRLYLRLIPADMALLKFLLEAHSHVGILSVVDRHAAVAKLTYSPDMEREVMEFLEQARQTVKIGPAIFMDKRPNTGSARSPDRPDRGSAPN